MLLLLLGRTAVRRTPGPTLPSRLRGCVEEGRRRFIHSVAFRMLLEVLRARVVPLRASAIDEDAGLVMMLCPSELLLVLRDRSELGATLVTGSGSERGGIGGSASISLPRMGSGEAWIELPVVMPVVSGVSMGEPRCELDAMVDGLLVAEGGIPADCELGGRFV